MHQKSVILSCFKIILRVSKYNFLTLPNLKAEHLENLLRTKILTYHVSRGVFCFLLPADEQEKRVSSS